VDGHLQEGEKVQSTWLYEWLARPTKVRPWLEVRMPTFGLNIDEATAMTKYFGALANVRLPYEFVLARDIPPEYLRAGRQLAGKDYFDCFSCHVQGDKKPEGSPEGWAPDLALARYRLRPAWIEKWLHDPQKIQPGTKMPGFFSDTEGIPDDVLKDPKDPDKKRQLERQIEALKDYVMSLGER
jgi:mono/diheme cytochrome c family protein